MAATLSTISFDDVTLGASVRFTTIEAKQYLSVRDLIMCLCEKDNKRAAEVWDRLAPEHKHELRQHFAEFQFPGRGQSSQPVITFPGAMKLAMILPGEKAKKSRLLMANALQRYYAGGEPLVAEDQVCAPKTLSFDEILPGNSVRVSHDNMIYAVDLVMVITGEKN